MGVGLITSDYFNVRPTITKLISEIKVINEPSCKYLLRRNNMLSYVRNYPLAIAKLMCLCSHKIC